MAEEQAFVVVQVACGSPEDARELARTVVQERLAACGQILPVRSVFRWQGEVQEAEEQLLLLKTTAARYADLERRLHELHGYEVPEILALPVVAGAEGYLAWVRQSVGEAGADAV